MIDVVDKGADRTGIRDSSAAFAAAVSEGPVTIPHGKYRVDNPVTGRNIHLRGDGNPHTKISLPPGGYLVDDNQQWGTFRLEGLRVDGGAGAVRNRWTGRNVNEKMVVRDCTFVNYTRAAISTNTIDGPYWVIEDNVFRADNYSSTIGVALSGLTDNVRIMGNAFQENRISVKLGYGGNNAYIVHNDFIRLSPPEGFPRIDVWAVTRGPENPRHPNSGNGMYVGPNKFGNELLDPADFRIVYADEETDEQGNLVGLFGDRFPVLDRESKGWIMGHAIGPLMSNGIGDRGDIPLVYSTTGNVVGGVYGPVIQPGTSKGYPVFRSRVPLRYSDRNIFNGLVGPELSQPQ